jgi:hypothetical protein
MFNPEKDFNKIVIETLGKDGLSISSLSKELENKGFKQHRLIITGYLRALEDQKVLREKDIPPSKIYIPIKQLENDIYHAVEKTVRNMNKNPDDIIFYVLYRLFRRPIFESELDMVGITRINGKLADAEMVDECKKSLKRMGNMILPECAYIPVNEYPDMYEDILASILLDVKQSNHLVMHTKQSKLTE